MSISKIQAMPENPIINGNAILAFTELQQSIHAALETYSNVHRGSGHFSLTTTHLYEKAREIVLDHLNLDIKAYVVIFCTPARAVALKAQLEPDTFYELSSKDLGLALAVRAIAVQKTRLPKGIPFETGGGTTLLASSKWVMWADAPDKFEAGTPSIINIIAFAKALKLTEKFGAEVFKETHSDKDTIFELLYHDYYSEIKGGELLSELRNQIIGSNIKVPTSSVAMSFTNMDHSASTPTFQPVEQTYIKMLQQSAEMQKSLIPEVKAICASFVNADPNDYDVVFTSNTTESINYISKNLNTITDDADIEPVVINSFMEHSSNDLPWRYISGCSLLRLDVNEEGFIDLKTLETLLIEYNEQNKHGAKRIKLVTVTGASNVLGICNDLKAISALAKKFNALLMVDAAQLIAHKKIDMTTCGIDFLVFSAHKIYAPFGTGVLVSRKGIIKPLESEAENAPGIAALGKSLILMSKIGMNVVEEHELVLTLKALKGMALIPDIKVFGLKDPTSPDLHSKIGVIPFSFKQLFAVRIAKELAMHGGIGIRFGCHCAHLIVKRLSGLNPFLEEIQKMIITLFPKMKLPGVARVSFGIGTTEEEIDHLLDILKLISKKDKSYAEKLPSVEAAIKQFISERERMVYDKGKNKNPETSVNHLEPY